MPNHTLSFDFAAPAAQKSSSPKSSSPKSFSPRNSSTSRRAAASDRASTRTASSTPAKAESAPKKAAVKTKIAPKPAAVKAKVPVVKAAVKAVKATKTAVPKAAKSVVETDGRVGKAAAPKKAAPEKVAPKKAAPEKPAPPQAQAIEKAAGKPAVKAKRVRAPKNLAAQYGETASEDKPRPAAEMLLEVPKKSRRTAKARAKRQEAMQVDDELLQRLARVGSASSLVIGGEEEPVKARRSRKWQVMCGKCGHEQSAKTAATLCDGCGTILLREAARLED